MREEFSHASISAVCVVEERAPDPSVLSNILDVLVSKFSDAEIVIAANGCSDATALALKSLTELLANTTVEFLASKIDRDLAMLVGMENAVGDWILLIEPSSELIKTLPAMLAQAEKGSDAVLGLPLREWRPKQLRQPLQRAFIDFYNWINGSTVLYQRPAVSLFSRPAALHILHSPNGEMLLRSHTIAAGFPTSTIVIEEIGFIPPSLSVGDSIAKAAKMLLASSTAPLRFITACGIMGGCIAMIYSLYVVGVYFFKQDVQQGWTTMSLQISFLIFFCSSMFALLAEYIAQIHAAFSVRRRYYVSRELRSPRSLHMARLNVVGSTGDLKVGFSNDAGPVKPANSPLG